MGNTVLGVAFLLASGLLVILGYLGSRRFFPERGPQIGAIDRIFTLRGLGFLAGYLLFHLLWFGGAFALLILGVAYLY